MIITKYQNEGVAGKRFVRASAYHDGVYTGCIQNAERPQFDLAQGHCAAEDLPDDVRAQCDAYRGAHYACEWPY